MPKPETKMKNPIKPLKRAPLLHVSVQESLRAYIEDNGLQAGAPLPPEGELAARLGVSRNSVREAIKALESVGVLESRRGIGVFVKLSLSSHCWKIWPMGSAAPCARSRK
ncbi:GntR family transcriptional regulator [Brucella abortus]|nr:GntR family transcriptional regulator [Brucella abortus]